MQEKASQWWHRRFECFQTIPITELENIKQIISSLVEECRYCVQASGTIVEDNAKQKEEIKAVLDEFSALDEQITKDSRKS